MLSHFILVCNHGPPFSLFPRLCFPPSLPPPQSGFLDFLCSLHSFSTLPFIRLHFASLPLLISITACHSIHYPHHSTTSFHSFTLDTAKPMSFTKKHQTRTSSSRTSSSTSSTTSSTTPSSHAPPSPYLQSLTAAFAPGSTAFDRAALVVQVSNNSNSSSSSTDSERVAFSAEEQLLVSFPLVYKH